MMSMRLSEGVDDNSEFFGHTPLNCLIAARDNLDLGNKDRCLASRKRFIDFWEEEESNIVLTDKELLLVEALFSGDWSDKAFLERMINLIRAK